MNDQTLASKVAVGAAWLMVWRLVARCLGLASTLLMARILVPSDFGLVAMATAFAGSIEALSEVGVQDALVRHPNDARPLYDTGFAIQVGRAMLTAMIIAAAAPAASDWFNEPRLTLMLLVLALIAGMTGLENIGIIEFRREMRYDVQFKMLLWPRLIQMAVTVALALMLQNYWALLIGMVAAKVVRVAMTYSLHAYRPRLRLNRWRELAGFSLWTWASCLAGIVWTRVDPFVLGPAIGPAHLGVYLLALELAILPISEIIQPIADALFTGFASAQKDGKSSVHHAPVVAAGLLICIAPLTIGISCTSGYLVAGLLGPKWEAASSLIAIMAWLCLFSPLTYVASAVLVANGYVRRNFYGRALAALVRLGVVLIAISMTERLDVIAVIVTLCVGIESCAFMLLLVGLRDVRLTLVAGSVGRTMLAGAAVVLLLYKMGLAWQSVEMASLPALLYGSAIGLSGIVTYAVLLGLLWMISGRPNGAETEIYRMAYQFARPILARFGR